MKLLIKIFFCENRVSCRTLDGPKLIANKFSGTCRHSRLVRLEKLYRVTASKHVLQEWIASNLNVSMPIVHLYSACLWVKFALGANQITLRGTFSTSHICAKLAFEANLLSAADRQPKSPRKLTRRDRESSSCLTTHLSNPVQA